MSRIDELQSTARRLQWHLKDDLWRWLADTVRRDAEPQEAAEILLGLIQQAPAAAAEIDDKIEMVRLLLMMQWAGPQGLSPTWNDAPAWKKIAGKESNRNRFVKWNTEVPEGRRLFDHSMAFTTAVGKPTKDDTFVISANPYECDAVYHATAAAWAERVGATVEYPEFPSWWYPGATTLVVFRKAETCAVQHEK